MTSPNLLLAKSWIGWWTIRFNPLNLKLEEKRPISPKEKTKVKWPKIRLETWTQPQIMIRDPTLTLTCELSLTWDSSMILIQDVIQTQDPGFEPQTWLETQAWDQDRSWLGIQHPSLNPDRTSTQDLSLRFDLIVKPNSKRKINSNQIPDLGL